MAFIYCKSCDWGQDDFWSEDGYNPFREDIIERLKKYLFDVNQDLAMDSLFIEESGLPYRTEEIIEEAPEGGWIGFNSSDEDPYAARKYTRHVINKKDLVVSELRRMANRIENMVWKTYEDFKNDPDPRCPKCGESNWSID